MAQQLPCLAKAIFPLPILKSCFHTSSNGMATFESLTYRATKLVNNQRQQAKLGSTIVLKVIAQQFSTQENLQRRLVKPCRHI